MNIIMNDFDLHSIRYEIYTKKREDEVHEFLVKYFLPEEPVARALNITANEAWSAYKEFLAWASYWQMSYLAIDCATNQVVGVCLSTIRHHYNWVQLPPLWLHQCYRSLLFFINSMESPLFKILFDAHIVVDIEILAVNPRYRGRGIAQEMVDMTLTLARSVRCQYAVSVATAMKSQNLFRKMHFEAIYNIQYDKYMPNGYKIIFTKKEEKQAELFALKLFP